MEKTEARREIGRRIAALTPEEHAARSRAIAERLLRLPEFARANVVMLFAAMADEADTAAIIRAALDAGKTVLLPKVNAQTREMIACPIVDPADAAPGTYGILEPSNNAAVDASLIEFCLVPARAFDRTGARLGRGAGYYDRFMASHGFSAVRCGIAFSSQLLDSVPSETHDLPVHVIVTDTEVIRPPV